MGGLQVGGSVALRTLKILFMYNPQKNTLISMALHVKSYSNFGKNQINSTGSSPKKLT